MADNKIAPRATWSAPKLHRIDVRNAEMPNNPAVSGEGTNNRS
jgi:hypothetical protein